MAWEVVVFYALLVAWLALAGWSAANRKWTPFFVFGGLFTIILNGRYIVEGMGGGIRLFVGIFDVVSHVGVPDGSSPGAFATCAGNACSAWGNSYAAHPSWAVAFYERFLNGPASLSALLYGHIIFNTIALVLATVQIAKPGTRWARHKTTGYITLASVVISLTCAFILNSDISGIPAYGASWTMWGLYFLGACVLVPAFFGIRAAIRRDMEAHRIWMWRFAGSLYGAFWIFRAEMLLVDLLVKQTQGFTLSVPAWTGGLIGIAAADFIRRRLDRQDTQGIVQDTAFGTGHRTRAT